MNLQYSYLSYIKFVQNDCITETMPGCSETGICVTEEEDKWRKQSANEATDNVDPTPGDQVRVG